ncbi:MAG: hypothetical protein AAGF83_01245 [Cyanobacteria bacterium P01_G01_bin.67]
MDLAVLRLHSPIPDSAIEKAENAYEVMRPQLRDKCFMGLKIKDAQIPRIIDGIDLLAEDFGLVSTEISFKEKHDSIDD